MIRASAVPFLLLVAVEAAAAFSAVTPVAARMAAFSWAPFLVAGLALSAASTSLGKKAPLAALFGFALAVGLGLGMAAVGQGALAGAGVAFALAILAGEVCAAGVAVGGGSERLAAATSLFACALTTSVLAVFGERIDIALVPGGIALGGGAAALQLAAARYADGAVAVQSGGRFGPDEVLGAAVARFTEVPRRMILAVLGSPMSQGEP